MQVNYFMWCITQETATCCNDAGKAGFVWAYWEWYVGLKCVAQILPQHYMHTYFKVYEKFWEELVTYLIWHGPHRKWHIQLLQVVVSLWSALKLYKQDTAWQRVSQLHDSQSRETVKYGHGSCKAWNQEWLCWQAGKGQQKFTWPDRQQGDLIGLLFQKKIRKLG
jgi:hypothetical protein